MLSFSIFTTPHVAPLYKIRTADDLPSFGKEGGTRRCRFIPVTRRENPRDGCFSITQKKSFRHRFILSKKTANNNI